MSLTTDRNDPNLNEKKENGQNESYLVLTEEERVKGYVRPLRRSYVHKGRDLTENEVEILEEPYQADEPDGRLYVATYVALKDEYGIPKGWGYLTQKELEQYMENGHIRGCGSVTTIGHEIAETYAVDPEFYGATYCVGCRDHININEFVWEGTDEKVGS